MRNGEFEPIVSEAISGVTEEGATVKVDDEADSHSVTGVRVDDLISEVEAEVNAEELCKICSVGKRDDNDVLIKCSHLDCPFKFYHMDCLKPRLRSPPPLEWYCPSCMKTRTNASRKMKKI